VIGPSTQFQKFRQKRSGLKAIRFLGQGRDPHASRTAGKRDGPNLNRLARRFETLRTGQTGQTGQTGSVQPFESVQKLGIPTRSSVRSRIVRYQRAVPKTRFRRATFFRKPDPKSRNLIGLEDEKVSGFDTFSSTPAQSFCCTSRPAAITSGDSDRPPSFLHLFAIGDPRVASESSEFKGIRIRAPQTRDAQLANRIR
jgi:hypothetical protein